MGVKRDIRWVSEARFKPYREECDGDDDKAWLLYEWNAKVASALTECIHHVEVLFRNSIMEQLEKIHPLAYPWHLDNKTIKEVAAKQSRDATSPAEPDDIIAHLNLGFWKRLLQDKPAANEDLWRHHLRNAFPHVHTDRKTVLNGVEDLFELRNRCAHHDSLLRFDPSVELKKIIKLASWIDPDAARWIEETERVTDAVRGRPVPPKLDTAIIGHRNDEVYTIYKKVGALVNSADRKIAPVTYIGFYHDKRIEAEFPTILEIEVPKTWSAKEAARLKKSSDAKEERLGRVMSCALKHGIAPGGNYEVYHLSPISSDETSRTRSRSPILHKKSGRGSGFVKGGLRYFSLSTLLHASDTTDLV